MNFLDIQCFLTAAKYSSITQAASELFLSRQTVSGHISQLEEELGCELFIRTPSAFYLSPAGIVSYDFFTDAEKNWKYTRSLVEHKVKGRLKVGCDFSLDAGSLLLPSISKFQKDHPDIAVQITSDDSLFLINQLNEDLLDLVIIRDEEPLFRVNHRKYCQMPFSENELLLIVSNDHPNKGSLAQDYADDICYIGNSTVRSDSDFANIMASMIEKESGIRFRNIHVLPNMDSVHSTILFSLGMTIDSPECGILKIPGKTRTYPLEITTHMVAVWKKSPETQALSLFIDILSSFTSKDRSGS